MPRALRDPDGYLKKLAKPLREKLRVARYIPAHAKSVLDVGCADGTVTIALANLLPKVRFFGIDLNGDFIERAAARAREQGAANVRFERVYLRDLLARPERFDAVSFVSVLHEFYTYGQGISSVLKALADAHELLRFNGEIVIRDMILSEYTRHTRFQVAAIARKVVADRSRRRFVKDFEARFGKLRSLYALNHFLLKYLYADNWAHECAEHYVPITFERYEQIFQLLGMDLQLKDSYLIPFLRRQWQRDFELTDDELAGLRSTGFLAARKAAARR